MMKSFLKNLVHFFSKPLRAAILGGVVLIAFNGLFFAVGAAWLKKSIIQEMRFTPDSYEKISRINYLIGQDLNELRLAFGLPSRTYPALDDRSSDEDSSIGQEGEERNSHYLQYYRAVENLIAHSDTVEAERRFLEILNDKNIASVLKRNGLVVKRTETGGALEYRGTVFFTCEINKDRTGCNVVSYIGTEYSPREAGPEFATFLENETKKLKTHFSSLPVLAATFRKIIGSPEISAEIAKKKLFLDPPKENNDRITSAVMLKEDRTLTKLKMGIDKENARYFLDDAFFSDSAEFKAALMRTIDAVDLRTSSQIRVESVVSSIRALNDDKGFRAYLASKNLTLVLEPREDSDYVYFDLQTPDGVRKGSFGIQKSKAEIYLLDNEDIPLGALKTFGMAPVEDSKKKISRPDRTSQINVPSVGAFTHTFLLVGAHADMTDTIILATVNEVKNTCSLISIPRDIFFRGRKINSTYMRLGSKQFVDDVSSLTGLKIEKYLIVDMFAFIDVVNILGGIDITLTEDLIDPTYRIKDGSTWSTLYYAAGRYHFNGIEALRVARSRHFTSDFGRAQRQQLIVASIKERISTLGVTDIGKLYNLIGVLLKYVETDASPFELVNYFLKFSNCKIESQIVLDTDNILYHTYTNLKHLDLSEEEVDETFDKGAYILLPKDDDWDGLRMFIQDVLKGSTT